MSRAAKQCREWIEAKHPGVRISRRSCRDTAGGSISQHSSYAYGEYDSNALDIMGGPLDWTREQNIALIDEIVTELEEYLHDWSINQILWKTADHYGHAHIDFSPMCQTHKWCGRNVAPRWRLSSGATFTSQDPNPENGDYGGPDEMTHFKIGEIRDDWEPVSWWLFTLTGGEIDSNTNSSQVQTKLPWKTNVRLVQAEDFELLADYIGLSDDSRAKLARDGLWPLGKELASARQRAYS